MLKAIHDMTTRYITVLTDATSKSYNEGYIQCHYLIESEFHSSLWLANVRSSPKSGKGP